MQLPDYHEVIDNPMDFGTVKKKLTSGAYTNLEQFEVSLHRPSPLNPTCLLCFDLNLPLIVVSATLAEWVVKL